MQRREFISLIGSVAAITWPLAARAQRSERMRRIGVILPAAANELEFQTWVGAFLQALAQLGWTYRAQRAHRHPLGHSQSRRNSKTNGRISRARTRRHPGRGWHLDRGTIVAGDAHGPVVFANVLILWEAACRQSGAAGRQRHRLYHFEYSLSEKWLIAQGDRARRKGVAVLRDPAPPLGGAQFGAIQSVAPSFGWSCARSIFATPSRSSAPSPPLRAMPMAV